VCVCVCVCEREREKERRSVRVSRKSERVRICERVFLVCKS